MSTRHRLLAGVTVMISSLALGTVTACSPRRDERPTMPGPVADAPAHITLGEPGRSVPLDNEYAPYSLDGSLITFPSSSPKHSFDQVEQVDVDDGSRTVVARTAFRRGFINWAVGTGSWVVYTDQSRQQSDSAPRVRWRVVARNIETGDRRVLASNGRRPDPFVPRPYSSEGYVYWSSAESDRSARETVWRPELPAPRTLLDHARFAPTSETISDGWLYYQAGSARPSTDPQASDCWRMPVNGGKSEPVTDSAFVMSCRPHGDRLVWTDHIDPTTDTPSDGDISDDPYELWARELGRQATLLHRGYFGWGGPVVAGEFVIWSDGNGHTIITSLQRPSLRTTIADDAPHELALVDDDRLVILTTKGRTDYAQVYDLDQVRVVR